MSGHSLVANRRMIHLERKEGSMVVVVERTAIDWHSIDSGNRQYIRHREIDNLAVELGARGNDLRCNARPLLDCIAHR